MRWKTGWSLISIIKGWDREARQKFWEEPPRSTKILFRRCGLICFHSFKKGTNCKTSNLLSFYPAQYPKRYLKSFHWGPFEAEHPMRYKTTYLTPKKVWWAPHLFHMRVPTRGGVEVALLSLWLVKLKRETLVFELVLRAGKLCCSQMLFP